MIWLKKKYEILQSKRPTGRALLTMYGQFFLSKAKLGTVPKSLSLILFGRDLELNPSSHIYYRGVVQKKFWPCPPDKNVQYFLQTDRETDEKKTGKFRDPKKYIFENL